MSTRADRRPLPLDGVPLADRPALVSRWPEQSNWKNMLGRCYQPKTNRFEYYGGRGITVCDRWRSSFLSFVEDMGPRPSRAHQIDRKDPDGHYEPGNCRWATRKEQMLNRRKASGAPLVVSRVKQTAAEAAKKRLQRQPSLAAARRLRTIRRALGLTIQKCAEQVGVTVPAIVDRENGRKTPTVVTTYKILAWTKRAVEHLGLPETVAIQPLEWVSANDRADVEAIARGEVVQRRRRRRLS